MKTRLPNDICIDLRFTGTCMFIGTFESVIMDVFWRNYPCRMTVKHVERILRGEGYRQVYTTMLTTTRKLHKKKLLTRVVGDSRGSTPHEFVASCSEDEFIELCIKRTVLSFREHFPKELTMVLDDLGSLIYSET